MADLIAFARDLRKGQTDAEQKIWNCLRARRFEGLKFRRQHPVGRYIADFICEEKKVIIELDGGQHVENAEYDRVRDDYLRERGYRVFRYWDSDVLINTEGVLESIRQAIKPGPSS